MFELTADEFEDLRSQIVTSNWGGTRYLPMAFTEQGVAWLCRAVVLPASSCSSRGTDVPKKPAALVRPPVS